MSSAAAVVAVKCSRCEAQAEVEYCVRIYADQLRWSGSTRCSGCDLRQEWDSDVSSASARAAIESADGRWTLAITSLGRAHIHVLRVIRDELGLKPAEARQRLDRLAGGLRVELEFLLAKLVAQGATGECRRVVD